MLPSALPAASDAVLIPNPGYPTYTSVTKLLEAEPIFYNLDAKNNWCPDFEALEKQDLSKVKIMWINYPHMPTGAKATEAIFKDLISEETPLIGIEPSAILTFRDEYIRLADDKESSQKIASHVYTIEEFLARELKKGNINTSLFSSESLSIATLFSSFKSSTLFNASQGNSSRPK